MKDSDKSILDKPWASTVLLSFLLLAVFFVWLYLPNFLTKEYTDLNQKGVHGDSYGSVNALFTGLAFAGLIFTIFLQQREIKLQRIDFKQTLVEYKASAEAAKEQSNALKRNNELNTLREEIGITTIFIEKLSEAIITANPNINRGSLQVAILDTLSTNRVEDALQDLRGHFRNLQALQEQLKTFKAQQDV